MAVPWGRWISPGGLQRQRRFEAVRKRAFGLRLPPMIERLQGIAQSEPPAFVMEGLAQRQMAAFQTPVEPRQRAVARGFGEAALGEQFGPFREEDVILIGGQEAAQFKQALTTDPIIEPGGQDVGRLGLRTPSAEVGRRPIPVPEAAKRAKDVIRVREALDAEGMSAQDFQAAVQAGLQRQQGDELASYRLPRDLRKQYNAVIQRLDVEGTPFLAQGLLPETQRRELEAQARERGLDPDSLFLESPAAFWDQLFAVEQHEIARRTRPKIEKALKLAKVPNAAAVLAALPFGQVLSAAGQATGVLEPPGITDVPAPESIAKFTAEVAVPSSVIPIGRFAQAGRATRMTARGIMEGTLNVKQDQAGRADRGEPPPQPLESAIMFAAGAVLGAVAPELIGAFGRWLKTRVAAKTAQGIPQERAIVEVISEATDESGAVRQDILADLSRDPDLARDAVLRRQAISEAGLEGRPEVSEAGRAAPVGPVTPARAVEPRAAPAVRQAAQAPPAAPARELVGPRQQNFQQFLRERGTPQLDEMDHGLLSPSGRVSGPSRRAAAQREQARLAELGEVQKEFQALVDSGAVVDPTGRYTARAEMAPPTVRRVDLEGRVQDTFATERELGGIRERQGGLPLEERPPAREPPDLFGRTERDIAEELRIVDEDLALPRLKAGARSEFRARRLELQEEQRILRLVREGTDTDTLIEGLERELEDVAFDLSRKGVPFGGRAGVSVREAAKQRARGRGTTISRTSLDTPQLQARAVALEDWLPRLREQARPFPPSADELVPLGVRDTDAAPVPRPRVLGGASETFAGPLRDFDEVVGGVVTSDNPVVRALAGRTGINPSVLRNTPLGRTTVAYWRQRIAADELVELAVQAAIDTHAQRGTGFARTFRLTQTGAVRNLEAPEGASRIWNDVFSTPDRYRLTSDQRAFIEDFRRVVEEAEFLRVQAGLDPRPTSGVNAATEGWFYVPRQVKGVRGVELRRPSSPRLQRQYEEAAQGVAHGVNYDNPRNTLRLHLRAAYQEIIDKQLSDHLETLQAEAMQKGGRTFVTPKELIREPVMRRMSDATLRRLSAERAVRRERAAILKQRQEAARGITESRVGIERARTRLAGTQDVSKAKGRLGELEAARTGLQAQREAARRLPRIRGRDVTEAVSPAAKTELEAARREFALAKGQYQKALEAARRSEIAPGTLFGRTEDTIAIGQWRNRFFPAEDAKALREGVEQFLRPEKGSPYSPTNVTLKVGNTIRFLASVGDFAEPFIQGQTVFAIDPARWARATKLHYQAFLDPTVQSRFIRENLAAFQEMAQHGTPIGDPEFFAALRPGEGFSPGQLLELLPKGQEARQLMQAGGRQTFGRFQASYNTGLGSSRALLTDALRGAIPDAAERQAFIRNATGGLDSRALGVGPGQRAVEGFALGFSPRFLRSTVALVGDLRLGLRDPRGRAAFASLTKLATAVTGLYVLSGLALNKSWEEIGTGLKPTEGKKFLAHEINGDWIGIGGQVRALVQLGAHMWVNWDNPGAFFELNLDNPLWRFWMFRGAPAFNIVGGAIEATTGADALPFDEVDSPADYVKHLGKSALPFAVQGNLEGENWLTTGFALVGARTSAETRFEKLQSGFEEKFGRPFNRETDFEVARQDPELAGFVGRSEQAAQRDELLTQEEQRLLPVAQAVLAGNEEAGSQFRRERSDFLTFAAGTAAQAFYGTQFPDPETPEGRILAEFYDLAPEDFRDPETLEPDFAQFDAARESLLAQLPQEIQRAISERTRFAHPDLQEADRRYRVARDLLDEAPSPISGMSVEEYRELQDFYGDVRRVRTLALDKAFDLSFSVGIQLAGQEEGRTPGYILMAQNLHRTSVRDRLRNPEYDLFLHQHVEELRPFYPGLFGRRFQEQRLQLETGRQPVAIGQ